MNWGRFQENQRRRGGHIYFALLAKWLRQHPTEAESRMWQILKARPQGYTFRRQQPLLWRIADFYCAQLRLVVEVDGGWHQHRKAQDAITNRKYTTHGIHILRFKNGHVLFRPERVTEILDTFISDISSPIYESSGTVGRCLIADFTIGDDKYEFELV
jgi:very-short-patch-repair endonuclease